jgi:hypothetical protein
LAAQDGAKYIFEALLVLLFLARNRNGFSLAGGGVLLDQLLDAVIIDILCGLSVKKLSRRRAWNDIR